MTRGGHEGADYPTIYLSDDALLRHTGYVHAVLRRRGVPREDIDDLVQETMLGAFRSMIEGRFKPDPRVKLGRAVRWWLRRIALNLADHELGRAHRRRERLRGLMLRIEAEAWDLDARFDAAMDILALRLMRRKHRAPILLRADGEEYGAIAALLGRR